MVCCSVLQCVAVRCSVLQCGAAWLYCVVVCHSLLQCVAVCCRNDVFFAVDVHVDGPLRVAVWRSVAQCVAVWRSVL